MMSEENKKTVNQLVAEIKQKGEDYEWYPTDSNMVDKVAQWIATHGEFTREILDGSPCGVSNGEEESYSEN